MFWPQYSLSPLWLLFWNQLSQGCSPSFMHGMYTGINTHPVMFYFQRQPYYPSLFEVSRWLILLIFLPSCPTPSSCIVKRSKRSSHQMEHGELPLVISTSGANWRWFSITTLTSYDRRIRVTLSIWQAVIRETIWRSLCFKWIIAWFTLPAWGAF